MSSPWLTLSLAGQGLMVLDPDLPGCGWAWGQIAVEPLPEPQHLEPTCLGYGSLHPHQDSTSLPITAASQLGQSVSSIGDAHGSSPHDLQVQMLAAEWQSFVVPEAVPAQEQLWARECSTWGPGTSGVPHPCCPALQGAADSGSHPAQHRSCHGMVFSCFSQSADACGNESSEGESKQG